MLAVFDQTVAKSPEGLRAPAAEGGDGEGAGRLMDHFTSSRDGAVTVSLGAAGAIAYSSAKQNPLLPRLFAVAHDIFCLFQGHMENFTSLKQQYGLGKSSNEDADGRVPFFWGTDSENHLILSDDVDIVKKGCGKSFAPFPKGCFFTTSGGLQSFEHPRNELKAMPRVDSQGQVCGATFKVDAEAKKSTGMPRVDSAANWSSQY